MKTRFVSLALVATVAMSALAQTAIVSFPESLGRAEYSKVAPVPTELKDVSSVNFAAELDGLIIAEFSSFGTSGICAFDANMNAIFPSKDFLKLKPRFVGVNNEKQIVFIRPAKKGAEIGLLDKSMNPLKVVAINADINNDKSRARMFVKDGKVYIIAWQKSLKPNNWVGYVLDAQSLEILSQAELSSSSRSEFTYSENKEYLGCVAINENKGKYLYHPLYNGAEIKLFDKNFKLLNERYVFGNLDDPWVSAQDEKTKKKILNGGMTGILTNGDANIQVNNDGLLRFITLDAASVHRITASSNEIAPIRSNRLAVYTLSANRNDSAAISDIMKDKIFMRENVLNADDDNILMQAWYKDSQRYPASTGIVVFNWDRKADKIAILKTRNLIFPAEGVGDPKNILYSDDNIMLVEHTRGIEKGNMFYDMLCTRDGQDVRFPRFAGPSSNDYMSINTCYYVDPIQYRHYIGHSKAADVFCFLVSESLNTGFNGIIPRENTKPLHLEFINPHGVREDFVFPLTTFEVVGFGFLGAVRSNKSLLDVTATQKDDLSILMYIRNKQDKTHQWVTLYPSVFEE